jgi:hypothetical protein
MTAARDLPVSDQRAGRAGISAAGSALGKRRGDKEFALPLSSVRKQISGLAFEAALCQTNTEG